MRLGLGWIALWLGLTSTTAWGGHLTARWFGVTGIALTDGEATLIFDPVFTKPTLRHWLFGARFYPDEDRIERRLGKNHLFRADAVFVSHTHFDHAVDAASVSRIAGATLYGGRSLERIVARESFPVRFERVDGRRTIQVGRFKVTMIPRRHPEIWERPEIRFLPGPVPEDFNFGFYQYREGEVWCFYVEHPDGNVLIDQSSRFLESNAAFRGKVQTYFVGVANKRSLDDLVIGNILRVAPKRAIPLHFDGFFLQAEWLERLRLLSGTLEAVRRELDRQPAPGVEWVVPIVDEPMTLP